MPIYDGNNVPDSVGRGTLDSGWRRGCLRGRRPSPTSQWAEGRRDHTQLGVGPLPPIKSVKTLVLPGPHGSVAGMVSLLQPTSTPSGALVYIHGGGFTYGTLDEFEVPMRLIAERAGIVTYIIEYQLAPEAQVPHPDRKNRVRRPLAVRSG